MGERAFSESTLSWRATFTGSLISRHSLQPSLPGRTSRIAVVWVQAAIVIKHPEPEILPAFSDVGNMENGSRSARGAYSVRHHRGDKF
jgi:hypothetical protein